MTQIYNETLNNVFERNRKCIINTDLDGLISGMFLQEFLGWEIVGFSSCCGKRNDNLWLKEGVSNINECVFVDLPVIMNDISIIDQHYVAFNKRNLEDYTNNKNKLNPNIMRSRFFLNNDYTKKYPFGTAHFILASLEKLNLIPENYVIDFYKEVNNFDLADLFLRADRVIGNTYAYTENCIDWSNWMINYGGFITKQLFDIVKTEYSTRHQREHFVESKLQALGCAGLDGECSNLFRSQEYTKLKVYFAFLSKVFNMKPLPIFEFVDYNNFVGERFEITNLSRINEILQQPNLFSFAFVSKKILSVTYIKGETKDE